MSDIGWKLMQAKQKGFDDACNFISSELEKIANSFEEYEGKARYNILHFASHIHDIAQYRKEYEKARKIQLSDGDKKTPTEVSDE